MFVGQVRKYVDSALESVLSPFVDSLDKAGALARKPKRKGTCPSRDRDPASGGSGLPSRLRTTRDSDFVERKEEEKLGEVSSGEEGSETPRVWWARWRRKNENQNKNPRKSAADVSPLSSDGDPFPQSGVSTDARRRRTSDLTDDGLTNSGGRTSQYRGHRSSADGASPNRKGTTQSSSDQGDPASPSYDASPKCASVTGSGDIVYTNIKLRRDLLSSSGLPFVLSEGVISSLRISIPPLLSLAPLAVSVEGVLLLFTPLPGELWSPTEVRRRAQQHRRALIADLEEQIESQVRASLGSSTVRSPTSHTSGLFGNSTSSHYLATERHLYGYGTLGSAADVSAVGGSNAVGAGTVGGVAGVTGGSPNRDRTKSTTGGGGVQAYIRNNIEQWLLGRIKVSIRNIHIRYEHPGGVSGAPFSCGIIIPFVLLNRGMPDATSAKVTHAAAAAAAKEKAEREAREQDFKNNRGNPAHVSEDPREREISESKRNQAVDGERYWQSSITSRQAALVRGGPSSKMRGAVDLGDAVLGSSWRVEDEGQDSVSEGSGATGKKEPVRKILLCSIAMYWNSGDRRLISGKPKAVEQLFLLAAPMWSSSPVSAARAAAADAEAAATELAAGAAAGKGRDWLQGAQGVLLRTPPEPPLPVCTSIELGGTEGAGDRAKQEVVSAPLSHAALARTRQTSRGLEGCSWLLRLSFFEFAVVLQQSEKESPHSFDIRVNGHVDPVILHVNRDMLTDMRSLQMHMNGFSFFTKSVLVTPAFFRGLRDKQKNDSAGGLRLPGRIENVTSTAAGSVSREPTRGVLLQASRYSGNEWVPSACQRFDESAKDSERGAFLSAPPPDHRRSMATLPFSASSSRSIRARHRWRFAVTGVCWLRQLQKLGSSMQSLVSPPVLTILKQQRTYIELRCRYRCEVAKARAARANASLLSTVYGKPSRSESMQKELARELRKMEEDDLLYLPTELVLLWYRQAVLDPGLPPYDLFLLHRHSHAEGDEIETDSEEVQSQTAADTQAVTGEETAEAAAVKAQKSGRHEVTFAAEHLESNMPRSLPRSHILPNPPFGFGAIAHSLPPLSISPFTFSASMLPRRIRRMLRSLFPGDDWQTTPQGNRLPASRRLFQEFPRSSHPPHHMHYRFWSSPNRWVGFRSGVSNGRWTGEASGGSLVGRPPGSAVKECANTYLIGGGWRRDPRRSMIGSNADAQSDDGTSFAAHRGDASFTDPTDDNGPNGLSYQQHHPQVTGSAFSSRSAASIGSGEMVSHWGEQGIQMLRNPPPVLPASNTPYAVSVGSDDVALRHMGSLKRGDPGLLQQSSTLQGLSRWRLPQDVVRGFLPAYEDTTRYPWEEGQQTWQKQQTQLHQAAMLELQSSTPGGTALEHNPEPRNAVGRYPPTLGPDTSSSERGRSFHAPPLGALELGDCLRVKIDTDFMMHLDVLQAGLVALGLHRYVSYRLREKEEGDQSEVHAA
ncbi:hypothetical protein TGRH88_045390 [Toxoplasma gondii]|uniref:Chorein N-terminal domain-containing protein n=1 Tax=Toxoplasma gondii TaxID=5811 RepID=A0A7J6JZJ8_TOXGO|nr:hypothetical protein TGRH88_045390 [Toxoplasma gondii]